MARRTRPAPAPRDDDMRFRMFLECNNAAFADDMAGELARVLREVADRIERGEDIGLFRDARDSNGNVVGQFALKPVGQFT